MPRIKIKVERRLIVSKKLPALISIISAIAGILAGGLLFLIVGRSPLEAYAIVAEVFSDPKSLMGAVEIGIPIMFTSLALVLPFRMAFFNIGGEGQFYMGAIGAMIPVILYWGGVDLPHGLYLPIMAILAALFGGVWALVPAFLRAKWKVNEILTSLMMNFIAWQFIWYLVSPGGPWNEANPAFKERYLAYLKEQGVSIIPGFKGTPLVPEFARPPVIPGTTISSALILAIIIAIIMYFISTRTLLGYEVRVVGESELASRYAGINYMRLVLIVMFISGVLAGLGGFINLSSDLLKLTPEIAAPGYGYAGIIAAWLSRLNPIACILVAVFFGALTQVGYTMQQYLRISHFVSVGFEGLIFLFLVLGDFFIHYRVRLIRGE